MTENTSPSESEAERHLRAFFAREMPRDWPAWRAPRSATFSSQGRWRSRAALVAALFVLWLSHLWLTRNAPISIPHFDEPRGKLDATQHSHPRP